MPRPNTRDAPYFASEKPETVQRFLDDMGVMFDNYGISRDEDKKKFVVMYGDEQAEDIWKSLPGYTDAAVGYADFIKSIVEQYPEVDRRQWGSIRDLDDVVKKYSKFSNRGLSLEDPEFFAYKREFQRVYVKLNQGRPLLSNHNLVQRFFEPLDTSSVRRITERLDIKRTQNPPAAQAQGNALATRPDDQYDISKVIEEAIELAKSYSGTRGTGGSAWIQKEDDTPLISIKKEFSSVVTELNQTVASLKDHMDAKIKEAEVAKVNYEQAHEQNLREMRNLIQQSQRSMFTPSGTTFSRTCFFCGGQHMSMDCKERAEYVKRGDINVANGKVYFRDGSLVEVRSGMRQKDEVESRLKKLQQNNYYGVPEEEIANDYEAFENFHHSLSQFQQFQQFQQWQNNRRFGNYEGYGKEVSEAEQPGPSGKPNSQMGFPQIR